MEEFEDFLSELNRKNEEEAFGEDMVATSIENTYSLLTGEPGAFPEYGGMLLTFIDPDLEPTEEEYDEMIAYFEDLEEYEKCAELLKMKKEL